MNQEERIFMPGHLESKIEFSLLILYSLVESKALVEGREKKNLQVGIL